MTIMTRRTALATIAQLAAAASLASCGMGGEDEAQAPDAGSTDLEMLASVAYDLFPHPSLSPGAYVTVGQAVPQDDPVVIEGLAQLRQVAGETRWKDLPEARRVAALTAIEDSAFFTLMRSTTANVLYSEPEVWEFVGYGGPALEKGGYLNRGFDDIAWLPETEGN